MVDLVFRVRKREKERLELRRRHVDPAPEQAAEELSVALRAACPRIVEVPYRTGLREKRGHRAGALDAPARRGVAEALLEPRASSLEVIVDLRRQASQYRKSRRGRERVSRERARLIDAADRCEAFHQLGPAAEGCQGEPSADDLAEH